MTRHTKENARRISNLLFPLHTQPNVKRRTSTFSEESGPVFCRSPSKVFHKSLLQTFPPPPLSQTPELSRNSPGRQQLVVGEPPSHSRSASGIFVLTRSIALLFARLLRCSMISGRRCPRLPPANAGPKDEITKQYL